MTRRRRPLAMTMDAVRGYAADALERAARDERGYLHCVDHLVALADGPVVESQLTCLRYFVAGYVMARLGRDNTEAEVAAAESWTETDAAGVAVAVRADARLADARGKLVGATSWFDRARTGAREPRGGEVA